MAYTVNKTDSSASPNAYTVQDGVLNTQTDLSLIGKATQVMENRLLKTFYTY